MVSWSLPEGVQCGGKRGCHVPRVGPGFPRHVPSVLWAPWAMRGGSDVVAGNCSLGAVMWFASVCWGRWGEVEGEGGSCYP
jgi:hypothetical protein